MSKIGTVFTQLAFATAFMGLSIPASEAVADTAPVLATPHSSSKKTPDKTMVGSSVVLVIDSSSSVDPQENAQMHEGIISALLDPKMDFTDCMALTAVHYADRAHLGKTHIVCNKEAAKQFAAEELQYFPDTKPNNQYGVGAYTNIEVGLSEARNVFSAEKEVLGIYPMKRSVVLIGDGHAQRGEYNLFPEIAALSKQFGATSFAIPIEDHQNTYTASAQKYYIEQLVSPAGLTYVDKDVWGSLEVPVAPGQFLPARSFADVKSSTLLALNSNAM